MDKDELQRLLNLKPTPAAAPAGRLPLHQPPKLGGYSSPPSPQALQLDAWDVSQGGKVLRHNHQARATKCTPEEMADMFGLNFLATPQPVELCRDERRLEFVKTTLDTPQYRALHRSTEHNPVASELAAVELAKSYAVLKEEDNKRQQEEEAKRRAGKKVDPQRAQRQAQRACLKAVGQAVQAASTEVDKYEETLSALGCGPGQGNDGKLDTGRLFEMFQKTRSSERLRAIMERAGRYRRCAQAQQRQKSKHGYDDMVGVVLDGDLGRLLPHELVQLACPELELSALRRLVERQSMCRQYRGVKKVGKGPIVVCVDESGSMSGEPIAQAKALALAMGWIARHQNRWIVFCGYSGGREGTRLALPPGRWDETALLAWLEHFYSGGTTLDVPLHELPHKWWPEFIAQGLPRGKTDLLLVTDALVHLPTELERSFLAWKQAEKVKCISLIIGQAAGDLTRVSDQVFTLDDLNLDQEGVQACFKI